MKKQRKKSKTQKNKKIQNSKANKKKSILQFLIIITHVT